MWPFKKKNLSPRDYAADRLDSMAQAMPPADPTRREAVLAVQLSEMHTQLGSLAQLRDQLLKKIDELTAQNKSLQLKLDIRFEIRELLTSIVAVQAKSSPTAVSQALERMKTVSPEYGPDTPKKLTTD